MVRVRNLLMSFVKWMEESISFGGEEFKNVKMEYLLDIFVFYS